MSHWILAGAAALGCSAGGGGGGGGSDAAGQPATDTASGADTTSAGGGLGCACPTDVCSRGFCSTYAVCTTNDPVECDSDTDCGCDSVCVVDGDRRTCQIPCADDGNSCPGQLECADVTVGWTTRDGTPVSRACLAPTMPPAPTWEVDIAPLVQQRCAGCHTGGGTSGGVALDNYADTQRTVSDCPAGQTRTVAEVMASKVSDTPACGSKMPLGGALDAADVERMAAWVSAGAPER